MIWDVAVIGLGAMGSASSYYLAQKGLKVLGLDRFTPPHIRGSSHGQTRIIREAYFEHPAYVPLLKRAYDNWQDLEKKSHESLLLKTGGLMIGAPQSELILGSRQSAEKHGIDHHMLTAAEIKAAYPAFEIPSDWIALKENRAGLLYPEKCIETYLDLAQNAGSELHTNEPLLNWKATNQGFVLETELGQYQSKKLVFCSGAWIGSLLPELTLPLKVTRQVLFWFKTPTPNPFALSSFPIFLLEFGKDKHLYGFPDQGAGFKVALHIPGHALKPDQLTQSVEKNEILEMETYLKQFFGTTLKLKETAVCMYTNTPDGHFLIDRHPQHPNLWIMSPCSGHGFKFASALGELVAQGLVTNQMPSELKFLSLQRFQ
jgi:sarcosine oxidase